MQQWRRKHIMTGLARPWVRDYTCELYAKIIAESELLQPALNEIHQFCFQCWSRGRGTCGTGSGTPVQYFHLILIYQTLSSAWFMANM